VSDKDDFPLLPLDMPPRHHATFGSRLRNSFLTGLIVAGPLTITLYLTWWFVNLIDNWVKPLIPSAYLPDNYLPFAIPGLGIVVAFVGLTLLGFLTANLVGRGLLNFGETLLERMPVVRGLYRGVKQVFETIFSSNGTSFRKVGLIEFPVKGTWSFVFIAAPPVGEIEKVLPGEEEHIGVFMPCTPNPTTGYFFYLPRKDVIELSINVDDAAKLVMSAGMIQPKS
jgi:uncharacterized membrane protein